MKRALLATTLLVAIAQAPAPSCDVTSSKLFTVTAKGFTDPNGNAWSARGLNAGVQDALAAWPQVMTTMSGMTMLRLNVGPGDTQDAINEAVMKYTSSGVMVEIETHYGSTNLDLYQQWAATFKDNPLVALETPNEPGGNVASDQVAVIQTIRAAGFNGPIGIQPIGGWNQANIPQVTSAVGTTNLYVTPHIYYDGTDPNGANSFVQGEISTAAQNGLFAVIDEFGNALDGFTKNPMGDTAIQAVVAANQAGEAGAVFWAMDNGNHPDGADSTFLKPDGSALTSTGQDMIKPWLSGGGQYNLGSPCAPQLPQVALHPERCLLSPMGPGCPSGVSPVSTSPKSSPTPSPQPTNAYTIDKGRGDMVMVNGAPATPDAPDESGSTSAITTVDGKLYGQDENTLQWFELITGTRPYWQPLQSLPTSGHPPVKTTRWDN